MRDGACPLMFQPWGAKNVRMWMGREWRKERAALYVLQNKKYTCELLAVDEHGPPVLFFRFKYSARCEFVVFNVFEKYFQSLRFTWKKQQTYQINIW